MPVSLAQSASIRSDPGVDQHLLETTAGGDDQDDAGDRWQRLFRCT